MWWMPSTKFEIQPPLSVFYYRSNVKLGTLRFLRSCRGAESILIPEESLNMDEVIFKLQRGMNCSKLHSIIVVAEGAASGMAVGEEIRRRTGLETRITILGHLQRGEYALLL